MTHAPSSSPTGNPLRLLPSVLAMPDLQRRLGRVLQELELGEDELVAILKLDPLAVVRGLRAANAAVFRQGNVLPTVRGMVRSLGVTLSKRLFLREAIAVPYAAELQQLWRHAVATAIAAEELAARTGLLEPEVAYLLGLVHDLPEWLSWLDRDANGPSGTASTDWILHWQLPAPLVSLMLAIDMGDRATSTEDPPDPVSLIRAAELMAELADYRHPGADGDAWLMKAIASVDKTELLVAQQLRRKYEGAMRSFGFDPEIPDSELAREGTLPPLFAPAEGGLDDVVLSILGCTRSDSYRGIITALTAAAVRYGGYDRAFFARWQDDERRLVLRSKADSSARPLVRRQLQVSEIEAASLREALAAERPAHLRAYLTSPGGLLASLSTDELLAIPLNREFATPAFLLLDRSLTLIGLDIERDVTLATMLGMTGSLLIQNLLLRRRRQRAQKYALTDPLTRLFNRRMGILSLEQAIARTERDERPLTVLMCDLDHFKRLNDTLGHLKGDVALQATADVLRATLRRSDTVCRFGGEEFLVVLPDTTPDEATVLATRVFTAVHARGEEMGMPITVSIGLTSHRRGDTIEGLLHRADRALYASKGYGRNRFSADVEEPVPDAPPDAPPDARPEAS